MVRNNLNGKRIKLGELVNIHIYIYITVQSNIKNTSSKGENPWLCDRPMKAHASRKEICLLYELPTDSKAFWACSDNLQ